MIEQLVSTNKACPLCLFLRLKESWAKRVAFINVVWPFEYMSITLPVYELMQIEHFDRNVESFY